MIQLPDGKSQAQYHSVTAGETWTSIAGRYKMSVPELTAANGMAATTPLQPGQLVFVPLK